MVSTIHNVTMVITNRIDRNTGLVIKKPECNLADQYLAYNPLYKKTLNTFGD